MADGESPCGLNAVGRWFGIVGLAQLAACTCLGDEEGIAPALLFVVVERQSAAELHAQVLDADIADGMSLDASYQTGIAAVGIGNADIFDTDATDHRMGRPGRRAHTVT